MRLKKELERLKKEAFLLFDDLITPEALRYMKLDAFVSVLCPRFTFDEGERFLRDAGKPILTPADLGIVMRYLETRGTMSLSHELEDYQFDEI